MYEDEGMSRLEDVLRAIPVYPETIKIKYMGTLPPYLYLCEDDKCNVSWISEEAKRKGLSEYRNATKTYNAPKSNKIIKYTAFGKTQTLHEWAEEYGIKYSTLNSRIRLYEMNIEEALTKPKQTNEEKVRPRLGRYDK